MAHKKHESLAAAAAVASAAPWGSLPTRMCVLYVTTRQRTGGWLADAFAADRAVAVQLVEARGASAALEMLREQRFDAVLISHDADQLDALALVEGLRGSGSEEPLVVLGAQSEQELAPLCYEVGADGYMCVHTATTRSLIWLIARAIERHLLLRENRRLSTANRQRLEQEHLEAQRAIDQQRSLIRDLQSLQEPSQQPDSAPAPAANPAIARHAVREAFAPLPPQLVEHYRQLLRSYVIMGAGSLTHEMTVLAELLASAGISSGQTLQLHLEAVEELVRGLGNRSARHVMSRADLLALEVMIHLAEGFRRCSVEHAHPPHQQLLPGFNEAA